MKKEKNESNYRLKKIVIVINDTSSKILGRTSDP